MASIFTDKLQTPNEQALANALGNTMPILEKVRLFIAEEIGPYSHDWKHYGKTSGWTLKTLVKKRNIFFISPRYGWFLMAFVFGDKAVAEVEKSNIPQELIDELVNARKYAEGRGLSLEVKAEDQYMAIETLIRIKFNS